jgi:tRNA dimethylallyltransferase
MDSKAPIVHLSGPTASGKSALAEQLCDEFPLELISVDSALIYRGMDIGSAKPDVATQRRCRYHLIDILEPEQAYSAAQFQSDANRLIADIHARGRIPLLVGGTMMYLRTLSHGFSDVPSSDPVIRAALQAELRERGLPALHAELAGVDPIAANRIHLNDPQRTLRALEVFRQTGVPLSSLQTAWRAEQKPADARTLRFALYPDRAWLHARIALRFEQMEQHGFLDEVGALMRRTELTVEHTSMRAVGYRQAWEHLRGDYGRAEFIERGIAATRQLAKRQITWIRSDLQLQRLEKSEPENYAVIATALRNLLGAV